MYGRMDELTEKWTYIDVGPMDLDTIISGHASHQTRYRTATWRIALTTH